MALTAVCFFVGLFICKNNGNKLSEKQLNILTYMMVISAIFDILIVIFLVINRIDLISFFKP